MSRWLLELLAADEALMQQLRAARALGLSDWAIGAGAVRNRTWNALFGTRHLPADVDLVYFDPSPSGKDEEANLRAELERVCPGPCWEVVNQARVHEWFEADFGTATGPLPSLEAGVGTWPETATCVAVRLDANDELCVLAPHSLDDLLDGVLRAGPHCLRAKTRREAISAPLAWASAGLSGTASTGVLRALRHRRYRNNLARIPSATKAGSRVSVSP
jgi:hypothetical protein